MSFFFFNDTATTEIYTLSLHDALPICRAQAHEGAEGGCSGERVMYMRTYNAGAIKPPSSDRKSTRLNSSHLVISYAVFCLKKKKIEVYTMYLTSAISSTFCTDVQHTYT